MKLNRTIIYTAAGLLMAACGNSNKSASPDVEATEPANAQTLIAMLDSASKSGRFYFGHHDDTAYGHEWKEGAGDRSDVKSVTGAYPGLMNWDLGMIELDSTRNLDGVSFTFMASEIGRQNARGGINAISWHPRNPLSGGDSWDVTASPLHELASNQALSDTVDAWIGRTADFIGELKDSAGNRIPVIFRPWHENTGTWFWWGNGNATPEEYIALWKRTRKIFDEKGIDNVVWAYSPDKVTSEEEYFRTYPGDEYVDILGTDIYHFDGEAGTAQYRERVDFQLPFVIEEARKRGKLAAFTETGNEGLTVPGWYTKVLQPLMEKYPVAYVCVWRNAEKSDKPNHYYVPFPGHPEEEDFRTFSRESGAIFVK